MSKSKKSVFNKPMREVKKPAKKIPVKKKKPSPVQEPTIAWQPLKDALDNLRWLVSEFKMASGEQDVSRANLNQFLAALDAGINKVSAIFEP